MYVFSRLGFLGRLVLIILLLLAALIALGLGLTYFAVERNNPTSPRLPFPNQAAAIIELLDTTPKEKQDMVLRAVSTHQLEVHIINERPKTFDKLRRMPGVEWLISQYLETFQDRTVIAVFGNSAKSGRLVEATKRYMRGRKTNVQIAVELRDGRFALFQLKSTLPQQLFGIPVGFWVGVFGSLFAAVALWAIAREARPLRRLVNSVEGFGHDGIPRTIKHQGAPEISRLIGAFNVMQERIAALLKGRTILLGAVSHDLKTFITRLRLRIEQIPSEDQRARAEIDLDDMTHLIDDTIAYARGASEPERRDMVDLAALLREESKARYGEHLELSIGDDDYRLRGDTIGIKRLLCNLIDNGLRYGSKVSITLSRVDGFNLIMIDDDGPGIPKSDRQTVFEPFYRLESSRNRKTGGSGLGLAIVKQIVETHNGHIEIANNPQGGARLTVTLPSLSLTDR